MKQTPRMDEHRAHKTKGMVTITRHPSMSEGAFRAKLIEELNNIGLDEFAIGKVVHKYYNKVFVNDSIRFGY